MGAQADEAAQLRWNNGQNVSFVPPGSALGFAFTCISYETDQMTRTLVWTAQNCDQKRYALCEYLQRERPGQPTVEITGKKKSALATCGEVTWKGVRFPQTRACELVVIDCPDPENVEGTMSRRCECPAQGAASVRWQATPDTRNCTHRWLGRMRTAVVQGRPAEGITVETAGLLRKTVQSLYGGDISGSVGLSRDLLGLARIQFNQLDERNVRQIRARNFTSSLGDCGDQLLSPPALPVWASFDDGERAEQATGLISALEQSTMLLAGYSTPGGISIDYKNWEMKLEVRRTTPLMPSIRNGGARINNEFHTTIDDGFNRGLADDPPSFVAAPSANGGRGGGGGGRGGEEVADDRAPFSPYARPPVPEPARTTTVSFKGVSKSPIISLPSLAVLRSSSSSSSSSASSPSGFSGAPAPFLSGATARGGFAAKFGAPEHFAPSDSAATTQDAEGAFGFDGSAHPTAIPLPSSLRMGFFVFTSLGAILSNATSRINSQVIGAAVDDATRSLALPEQEPVTLTFFHLYTKGVVNPRCVFWDTKESVWSTAGCMLLETNTTVSLCQCSHLTSFAIIMDVTGRLDALSTAALDVVTVIGCALSSVCLAAAFLVFVSFRSLRGLRSTIHANLALCLLIGELVFVIGIDRTEDETACAVTAILLHLVFLAAFCWMLLEGVQLWMMLVQVFEPSKTRLTLFYLFAYGAPAIVVAVSAGVSWENYGTPDYCWIDTTTPTIWAFAGPVAAVAAVNVCFLAVALRVVLSINSRDRSRTDRLRGWLKGSATLLCLLGITWIFGFLTAVHGPAGIVFAWIFTVLNCTQGVFIFTLHVLLNDKARGALVRWLLGGSAFCCCGTPESAAAYNSKEFASSRQRFMRIIRGGGLSAADLGAGGKGVSGSDGDGKPGRRVPAVTTSSGPSTASTDSKEHGQTPATPTSKSSGWASSDDAPSSEALSGVVCAADSLEAIHDTAGRVPSRTAKSSDELVGEDSGVISDSASSSSPSPPSGYLPIADPAGEPTVSVHSREDRTPVKRRKFPLGATVEERRAVAPTLSAVSVADYRF